MNNLSISNYAKGMDITFKQQKFVIESITLNDLNKSDLPEDIEISMELAKSVAIRQHDDDPKLFQVVMNLSIQLYDESHGENPIFYDFLNITVKNHFLFITENDQQEFTLSPIAHNQIVHQTNIQVTDLVNTLIQNSPLEGEKISYEA